jgi:AcrR family transcriptional regulator
MNVAVRLTRVERREQTRGELLAAARQVFLRRGFHQASLEEIAEEAGYTKGAVYSNFAGKDELFLAVLTDHDEHRRRTQIDRLLAGATLEGGLRAAAREVARFAREEPEWAPLLAEFWTHAARHEHLRRRVAEGHELGLDGYATVLSELAERYGLELTIPVKEVARSTAALSRGLTLEAIVKPGLVSDEDFEELFASHIMGLTRTRKNARTRRGQR